MFGFITVGMVRTPGLEPGSDAYKASALTSKLRSRRYVGWPTYSGDEPFDQAGLRCR